MPSKLKTSFRAMTHPKCLLAFQTIMASLTNNQAFPEPWNPKVPSLAALGEAIARYQSAYDAARNGDRVYIALRNSTRDEVASLMEKVAAYLEVEGADNPAALLTTGFELKRAPSGSTPRLPLSPPLNFRVVNAEHRGVVIGSAKRVPGAASYEAQVAQGDPSTEQNWKHLAVFACSSKMVVSALDPGTDYFFRVRAIGSEGPGPWSNPAHTIVT